MTGLDLLAKTGSRGLLIAGKWRESNTGARFQVHDPADESVITDVADGDTHDAMAALDAAVAVQADWAATAPRERGEILRRAFEAVIDQADDFAELISLEMGKTLAEARGEVTYGAEFLRWFSEEAVRIHGRWMQAPAGGSRLLTIRKPVGPCLFITPWNFPLAMGTRKIGPAVAAGCTMIVKPAELTPLTMIALAQVMNEAGLPPGVLNIVTTHHSKDLSSTLMADERLRKVSFTGSTPVGKVLVRQSADQLQRMSMELGGNAPFVVFEDADVEAAVDGAMVAKMRNMGEAVSSSTSRWLAGSGTCSAPGWGPCAPAVVRTPAPTWGR
jgi:succinate-semialdehyde dehydrogenase / glutarate-semialdehyde dehydrogenase